MEVFRMKREARMVMKIFVICSVVVGVVVLEVASWKVFKTAVNLSALNSNARFYNEQSIKTDEMSEEYQANQKERQKFYNSDDVLVRFYSNSNVVAKIALWLATVLFLAAVPLSAVYLGFVWLIEKCQVKEKRRRLKRKTRRAIIAR